MHPQDMMKMKLLDELESHLDQFDADQYSNAKMGKGSILEGSTEKPGDATMPENKTEMAETGESLPGAEKTKMLKDDAEPPHLTHGHDRILMHGQFAKRKGR